MAHLIGGDEWTVVQDGLDLAANRVDESLFSLGNGNFGGRGNHEEQFSGDSLRGNYLAGIYYPDPTRVGWWKNGYPDYFAKVLNAADWTSIHIWVDGEPLDLFTSTVETYRRTLHLRTGELERSFRAVLANGCTVEVDTIRFLSMVRPELGAIRYRLTMIDTGASSEATVRLSIGVDGDVTNEDSNHEFGFWDPVSTVLVGSRGILVQQTKKTEFHAATATDFTLSLDGEPLDVPTMRPAQLGRDPDRAVAAGTELTMASGHRLEIVKFGANVTSRTMPANQVAARSSTVLDEAMAAGFDQRREEHCAVWEHKWQMSDVAIGGDPAVAQGMRFNIFQLHATFTGVDPDLNIGPKGFTGEKYGGVTYWDTEAFCLPFYLASAESEVSKNLLRYRYRQLDRAIENAAKLGFDGGAALYPMVTINGEECHNEWEITFEEIHRNGAIAFAIFNYIRTTGDRSYLLEGGLEVLIAIARFWSQRVSYSEPKQAWVILGVTGPNEFENNVDNNWYTNLMAQWTLRYAGEAVDLARAIDSAATDVITTKVGLVESDERRRWSDVAEHIFLPEDAERGIFLQQGNYLDKELLTVDDLDPAQRPIVHHWSWDRILRSCFIKQADVLQGLWVFEDRFDLDTIRANFDFYEPRTVHESSLSPSVHAVLAVRLGRLDKALEMLRRSARLDLDNINDDTRDGCHVTSMAGTWIAAVIGFGGLRVVDDMLHLDPILAPGWTSLGFQTNFRGVWVAVVASGDAVRVENRSERPIDLVVAGTRQHLGSLATITVPARR